MNSQIARNATPAPTNSHPARRWWACSLLVLTALLQACGGGSSTDSAPVAAPSPVQEKGDLIVSITDAPGDFLAYIVDVQQLTLYRANGDVVETLPFTTRIDFTELVEVSEFLTIASVPAGDYDQVSLTLDYTNAEIVVQDDAGNALAATAVDASGNPLGVFDLRLDLTNTDTIRISPGRPAAFSLDFDLDASNDIDLATSPPSVSVDALLLASAELETDRDHRVRGLLAAVSDSDHQFTLKVRPFRVRNGDFGRLTVNVDEETRYEVDGVGLSGADGLRAMAALAPDAPVVSNGPIQGMSMLADTVIAGSSVPWADTDLVTGVVTGRSGDQLTVRGARVDFAHGTRRYIGSGTILLGPGTTVTAPGIDNAQLSTQSISVGQRIIAFGELVDGQTLDAGNSRVVMRMNTLTARVVDAQPLAVDLALVNGHRPLAFDFSRTGVDASMDADPGYYEIDTGMLSLDPLASGDRVRIRGLVNAFGAAPADFNARTVIDIALDSRPAALKVVWPEGTQLPFHSVAVTGIDVDLSDARHALKLRGIPVDRLAGLGNVLLSPTQNQRGLFAVKVRGSGEIHLYRDFAGLTAELQRQLDAGARLHHIAAHGRYNALSNNLTSVRASFVFAAANDGSQEQ